MSMKKYILLAAASILLYSCSEMDEVKDVEKIQMLNTTISINVKLPDGVPAPTSYTYKLNNFSDKIEIVKTGDGSGSITLDDVIPGIYTINVSSEVVTADFTYNFNGSVANEQLLTDNKKVSIDVAASRSGNIIFKELYYCGSKTPSGGSYFRDQYYELYNNSSSVQYLDGLCIGNINPVVATANLPSYPGENPDDYLYFLTVWQIPGIPQSLEGSTHNYPIQPGESVIIAQMADNHQRAELNPACPVNLLSAEFEAYLQSTAIIKDNPAINMHLAFWPRPTYQWLVTVFGGAYAIFYPDHEIDPNEYTSPINSTSKLCKISIDCVVDAVELVNDPTKMKLKRMPAVLDAGATTVSATYCGKSVARKIKSTLEDGRIIYQDTNNSTEDFEVMDKPVPRRNGAKIPAWNTWAN